MKTLTITITVMEWWPFKLHSITLSLFQKCLLSISSPEFVPFWHMKYSMFYLVDTEVQCMESDGFSFHKIWFVVYLVLAELAWGMWILVECQNWGPHIIHKVMNLNLLSTEEFERLGKYSGPMLPNIFIAIHNAEGS